MSGSKRRMLLQLTFDKNSTLTNIEWEQLYLKDITTSERASFVPKIEEIKARRLAQAVLEDGKIERNDKCPCGSGRKYKKCCL